MTMAVDQMSAHDSPARAERLRVWDLPTRVFHWALAASFCVAWVTSEEAQWQFVHVLCGYLVAALVLFRLVWAFVGGHYARLASFRYSPRQALDYVRLTAQRHAPRHVGHNPAGSWAIYGLLGLALVVVLAGVLTLGAQEGEGPAAAWMRFAWLGPVRSVHALLANAMMALVGLHLAGVVVESWLHRENLAASMWHGFKRAAAGTPQSAAHAGAAVALVAALLVAIVAWVNAHGGWAGPPAPPKGGSQPVALAGAWQDECSSCHDAFTPQLLPARSWHALLAQQSQHFGTDLALEAAAVAALQAAIQGHTADTQAAHAGYKILRSLAPGATPLRMTETPMWKRMHRHISQARWHQPPVGSQDHCSACHQDAATGVFDRRQIEVPPLT